MLDEIESKTVQKTNKVIDRGKISKTLSEVKPVENKQESSEFCRDNSRAKGSLFSHKLLDHTHEY